MEKHKQKWIKKCLKTKTEESNKTERSKYTNEDSFWIKEMVMILGRSKIFTNF